ncbi:MotY family protein [Sansalvadorimonas verongulae]|uniref:MotY family protein n=1 Tax=Sansalvadorimonas verongulae TaxID=2172824 RepID=UPI0012BD6632|nr:OmpA family protein [Sansalvadorimonas verongulae]MTI13484.1 OmpA family protein [Sansalvadorimonas verongulae]
MMFRCILNKTDRIQYLAIIALIWSQPILSNPLQDASPKVSTQLIDIDQSNWQSRGNRFACYLTQSINNGYIEFIARAGHPLSLSMYSGDRSSSGTLTLIRTSPPWKPNGKPIEQGKGTVSPQNPYQPNGAEGLLRGLMTGEWGKVVLDNAKGQHSITLSSTGIHQSALAFQGCRNNLLPASFDQISLLRVQFSSGKTRPQPRFADNLSDLATYVSADENIVEVLVDGHTDSAGHHLDNLQIAKDRADSIASYLQYLGIPEDKIKTRFHSDRYPVATNNTAAGRAQNRRVEVRLIRKNTPPDPQTFFSK